MPVNKIKRNGSYAPLSAHYYKDDALGEAGEAAELLYVRGLAFCADVLSDGFISDRQLVRFVGVGMDDVLERARLLVESGGPDHTPWIREAGGYRVRSWLKWNRSKDEITEYQSSDAARKRKQNQAPPDPPPRASPPRPSRNGARRERSPSDPTPEGEGEQQAGDGPAATPIPDDWTPHDIHGLLARQRGVDVAHEAAQFRAYSAANGRTYRNVHEAFRYWLGNAKPPRGGHQPAPDPDRPLTNEEVDDILGPETGPLAPPEVENGDPAARHEWYVNANRAWREQRRQTAQAKLRRRAAVQ